MMEWQELVARLSEDEGYQANKELAKRVVSNEPKAVHYYLTVIGMPIMGYIERSIMHRDITAEYYIFLSHPFDGEKERPLWHRVDLYNGIECLLSSYTSKITCRYFCKLANKEKKRKECESELLEYVDYESLLKCEAMPEDGEEPQIQCVRQAYLRLPERYRCVLRCLVIDQMSALDAFPLLSPFVHPRPKDGLTSDGVKASWTVKQRQDALSLLKGYALKQLQRNFDAIKEQYNK